MKKKLTALFLCFAMIAGLLAPGMESRAAAKQLKVTVTSEDDLDQMAGKTVTCKMTVKNKSSDVAIKECTLDVYCVHYGEHISDRSRDEVNPVVDGGISVNELFDLDLGTGESVTYTIKATLPAEWDRNYHLVFRLEEIDPLDGFDDDDVATTYECELPKDTWVSSDDENVSSSLKRTGGSLLPGKKAIFSYTVKNNSDKDLRGDSLSFEAWDECNYNFSGVVIKDSTGQTTIDPEDIVIPAKSSAKCVLEMEVPSTTKEPVSDFELEFMARGDRFYYSALKRYSVTSHKYTTKVTKATPSKNGKITKKCSDCGKVTATTIYRPKTIKLSKTAYTYNGKVHKPKVTVKNAAGKTISSKYYTVTYPKGCKKRGKYTVTVKFKGNYSGTMKKSFRIK